MGGGIPPLATTECSRADSMSGNELTKSCILSSSIGSTIGGQVACLGRYGGDENTLGASGGEWNGAKGGLKTRGCSEDTGLLSGVPI